MRNDPEDRKGALKFIGGSQSDSSVAMIDPLRQEWRQTLFAGVARAGRRLMRGSTFAAIVGAYDGNARVRAS